MPVSADSREKFIKAELRRLSDIFKEVVNSGNSLIKDGLAYIVIWDDLNDE